MKSLHDERPSNNSRRALSRTGKKPSNFMSCNEHFTFIDSWLQKQQMKKHHFTKE